MHKLSAFSHRNIDVGFPVSCFFFPLLCSDGERGKELCKSGGVAPLRAATAELHVSLTRTNWEVS